MIDPPTKFAATAVPENIGSQLFSLTSELYPIPRSITGHGFRRSLDVLRRFLPIEIHEVPSGTQVLDWTVPDEWNLRRAWIKDPDGRVVVDSDLHALHVVGYSEPVHAHLSLADLQQHLHSLPDQPDWIPYRTSYYKRTWGFCLAHRQRESMRPGTYEVTIDGTLAPGHLTYGELLVRGRTSEEVLLSCHGCHPSLANDNAAGMALATHLAQFLSLRSLHYSYRFLFIPGTIGSITWLARNEETVSNIRAGLVISCVGDRGDPTYKRSRQGDALIDRAAAHVLKHRAGGHTILDFSPYGYDERQYCSPGFNLPVGCLMRTPNGKYPQYHTSADDLNFIDAASMEDSLRIYLEVIDLLEHDRRYINLSPKGEPQLGKRGLYRATGGGDLATSQLAMLWVLNQSDGNHSLLDIAERAAMSFTIIKEAAAALEQGGLLQESE